MNRIKLYPYINLTNDQLIDLTIKEMDKLKFLSKYGSFSRYDKKKHMVNQLIVEVKRRNLEIEKPLLVRRIFNK